MRHLTKFNEVKLSNEEKKAKRNARTQKIEEIKSKMKEIEDRCEVIHKQTYDWKEISQEVYADVEKIVVKLGGYFYDNPEFEGSDAYGMIVTKKPMSDQDMAELTRLAHELNDIE